MAPQTSQKNLSNEKTPAWLSSLNRLIDETANTVEALEDRFEQISDEAKVQGHLGFMELAERWQEASNRLQRDAQKLWQAEGQVAAAIDTAKVKAHLAKADAKDAAQAAKADIEALQALIKKANVKAKGKTRDALKLIAEECLAICAKIH